MTATADRSAEPSTHRSAHSSTSHSTEVTYEQTLRMLSEASVEQHFDAFLDIDWDHPDFAIDPTDRRWVLPKVDVLGRTEWYQSLPLDEQIRIGLYRQANVTKVGLQFEQVLIAGLMNYALGLPNGSAEFRYATHEATEECHHTQMFQEFVNRSGQDVQGGSRLFRGLAPILPLAAKVVPFGFYYGVLAGEEPIDHVQKSILRAGDDMHPLLQRIMQIHVAEEARHIGFAHQFLEHNAHKLNRGERFVLSLLVPVILKWLCNEILVPSKKAQRDMGIPKSVMKQVYWDAPESKKFLRDLFGDVRMLAENTGMMNTASRRVWRAMGIDGKASRFRSEPSSAAA